MIRSLSKTMISLLRSQTPNVCEVRMSPNPLTAGLLGHAYRWSIVGMITGPVLGLLLVAADLLTWSLLEQEFILMHFHSVALVVVLGLTLGSLAVHLAARSMIYQRQTRFVLLAELRGVEPELAPEPKRRKRPAKQQGLTPEIVALGRSLSSRLER